MEYSFVEKKENNRELLEKHDTAPFLRSDSRAAAAALYQDAMHQRSSVRSKQDSTQDLSAHVADATIQRDTIRRNKRERDAPMRTQYANDNLASNSQSGRPQRQDKGNALVEPLG